MKKTFGMSIFCVSLIAVAGCVSSPKFQGADAPRMSKQELNSSLGGPELVIIDVRQETQWTNSAFKIKGAVRKSAADLAWASKYPKGKTIVL